MSRIAVLNERGTDLCFTILSMVGKKGFGGVQVITLPAVSFFGIKPCPEELEVCPKPWHFVFGSPFPNESFPHIYKGMEEAEFGPESYEGERLVTMQSVEDICEKGCGLKFRSTSV